MSNLREAAQAALDALDSYAKSGYIRHEHPKRRAAGIKAAAALRAALAQPDEVAALIGAEWNPCHKKPVTVHVREQRPGEAHVSTREGLTPMKPDDLIMRGVQGEEYPIGREIFEKTYNLGAVQPEPVSELDRIGRIPAVRDRAGVGDGSVHDAVVALSGALAQPGEGAEPVAWIYQFGGVRSLTFIAPPVGVLPDGVSMTPLYAHPPKPCACGDRPADKCPGEWEPGCDLGANAKYARRVNPVDLAEIEALRKEIDRLTAEREMLRAAWR